MSAVKDNGPQAARHARDRVDVAAGESRTPNPESRAVFQRRDLLKALTSVPAAALVTLNADAAQKISSEPPPTVKLTTPTGAEVAAGYQRKILTEHEYSTIRILSDWIIPADERSGSASAAGVPEFIDDWLDFKRGELLDGIRGGLTWLDMECNRAFGRDFADCTAAQQKQLLGRIAYPQNAAPADANAAVFFNHLRDLVVSGFFTSEIGLRDLPYLGNEPQAVWQGCPAPVLAKLGLGK